MSQTKFVTNDALTRKRWANELFRVLLPAVEYNSLVGTSADSIVQIRTELGKGEGDNITFGIRLPLTALTEANQPKVLAAMCQAGVIA